MARERGIRLPSGAVFSDADNAQLAALVFRRCDGDLQAATYAWNCLTGLSLEPYAFAAMLDLEDEVARLRATRATVLREGYRSADVLDQRVEELNRILAEYGDFRD